ncbi:MAG: metal-dependent hydrolase [Candidatus Edwardsbacteria bacterium RIFOXYD12_FULL_50_11]|uniref:Metal-dependent hydrolase n=1 Tax=Candidatus Edwardsbacteria bacterium GWF2_54_11 TaxID=1817851 RepID=A0A1F5RC60_9BACT|nr:MAG: metal-dependent hydrolase [Candidatus Edwardsbacteria bacterium RifOxyC12_full_54_24]OGF07475.1 MAG: metal-dependent hydrolase [Candidatus Edwardsbacteria bacterium RifOxyA12_full_54_48]OGF09725.1 MAG: metal-dependent hydrolase [Candidatus Edwardsbacteria bacterium GWE2_54_12]OGF11988.1 MAG: metal-dependent hydrolase [Candidatus Edwardsbacteria bacterium GWF2_54_11]OGF16673.1 MAG: metal-dependent hydrolase [Candidatus Edwardsbacteria bacterium RIFOXYD12_FULL_50_11]OGJ19587.1 MAG: metal
MKTYFAFLLSFFLLPLTASHAQQIFETDTFTVGQKKLVIHFIGHGTIMMDYDGLIIHVDPVGRYADYTKLAKADIILVTHQHQDHLDKEAIARILSDKTRIILNRASYDILGFGKTMANGDTLIIEDIKITAVPAYNTTKGRDKFHPKGRDNGYVLDFGGKKIYIAGDTEDIPEMKHLKNIDIAFLPMNQPYTMTAKQLVKAIKMINPLIVYPYHYGDSDLSPLPKLLKGAKATKLRIRRMN